MLNFHQIAKFFSAKLTCCTVISVVYMSLPTIYCTITMHMYMYMFFSPSGGTEEVDDLRLTLDKTKRLLVLQSKISSDYKKELEILQNEVKKRQNECEDLKQVLDMKNDKIKVSSTCTCTFMQVH